MPIPTANTPIPKDAQVVTYYKMCNCEDATASTARLALHMQPEPSPKGWRDIKLTISTTDLACDKCGKAWALEVQQIGLHDGS